MSAGGMFYVKKGKEYQFCLCSCFDVVVAMCTVLTWLFDGNDTMLSNPAKTEISQGVPLRVDIM